jgi:ketosteroid isomerase-like protein
MSVELTRELVRSFAMEPHPAALADDAIFVFRERHDEGGGDTTCREVIGRDAITRALDHFYRRAGVLHTPADEVATTDGRAMVEVAFFGRDLGGFFGLATTPEPVVVPCAMICSVDDGRIRTGYLTFDLALLRQRVGAARA